jgi:cold shock protein
MAYGTVKFFNVAKGFGFITADEGGKDVFVPAASITAAKISGLKTGQRVSFESEPDKKGPKAVNLQVIAAAEAPAVEKRMPDALPREQGKPRLTVYLDSSSDEACDVLAELRESGHDPHVVDYIVTPPAGAELRRLSMLLRDSNQSLVRKYDPLFMALQLDDRFISDTEFWGAIHEHPTLINGPVVATATQARLCHSADAVETFMTAMSSGVSVAAKPKGLSERLLQLVAGGTVPPRVAEAPAEKPERKPAEKPVDVKVVAKAPSKAIVATKPKTTVKAKVAAKAKPPAKPSPKPVKKPTKKK